MLEYIRTPRIAPRTLAVFCWIAMAALARPAAAQSAATQYTRLLVREQAARAAATPNPTTLRSIAKAYEAIPRLHPTSGYADNALWQAAGVLGLLDQRSMQTRDREEIKHVLTWLIEQYPSSSLKTQATTRLASLETPARTATPVKTTAPVSAPTPAPAPSAPPTVVPATAGQPAAARAAAEPSAGPAGASASAQKTSAKTVATSSTSKTSVAASTNAPAPPVIALPLAPPPRPPGTAVRSITHTALPRGDRITVELAAEVPYSATRVSNPDRVLVDLMNAEATTTVATPATSMTGGLVKGLKIADGPNNAMRLVLEVNGSPRYSMFPLYNPFRLVIDIESETAPAASAVTVTPPSPAIIAKVTNKDAGMTAAGHALGGSSAGPTPASPASTGRGDYSLARQLGLGVSRIVIDPGHGGHDPGAQANGVTEADLVLDVAQRLETLLLAQRGFEVVLTRRTNDFVALEERTAIANREGADLFLSIHANASPQATVRGIETFFLDFAKTPHAEAVAARENASSEQSMNLLPQLVKTIALANKLDESRELATDVQASLMRRIGTPAKGLKDLGVKQAPFVVLIGAQMPSVLAEISFLTNRSDASLLSQAAYRQKIAQALYEAVVKYQGSLKKVTSARTKTGV